MNRRYIDFVPPKQTTKATPSRQQVAKTTKKVNATPRVTRTNEQPTNGVNFATHAAPRVELGVIEDLSPKFINTATPKRPLNSGNIIASSASNNSVSKTKSTKNTDKTKANAKRTSKQSKSSNSEFKTPKTPFINLDKVTKRPLSKNVYHKDTTAPKEEAKGPVTIIAKPEKDSHIGLIVTIILTIILGAAAGTVAFLRLPK